MFHKNFLYSKKQKILKFDRLIAIQFLFTFNLLTFPDSQIIIKEWLWNYVTALLIKCRYNSPQRMISRQSQLSTPNLIDRFAEGLDQNRTPRMINLKSSFHQSAMAIEIWIGIGIQNVSTLSTAWQREIRKEGIFTRLK